MKETKTPSHRYEEILLESSLVGGFNPFDKYARQIGFIFPNFRGENKQTFELPPTRWFGGKPTILGNPQEESYLKPPPSSPAWKFRPTFGMTGLEWQRHLFRQTIHQTWWQSLAFAKGREVDSAF